jgi:uncharacterized membrane protein
MIVLRRAMRWLFGLLFMAAGTNHFINPDFYVSIVPPYLPWHLPLVYASGVAEVVLGTLLLVPRFQAVAAWGLIALLLAVFPANLHMAMNPDSYPELHPFLLWARLPLQGLIIAWAYWFTGASVGSPDRAPRDASRKPASVFPHSGDPSSLEKL